MSQNRRQITKAQQQKVRKTIAGILQNRKEIVFSVLYGSFQQGMAFEDVDLAVYLAVEFPEEERFEKESEFSLELEKHLEMPVDVRILNGADLGFQYVVSSGELLFSRKATAFYDFRERVWLHYLDHKYFYEQSLKDLLAS